MSWINEDKRRIPDQISVSDLNSFSIRCGTVTEFDDYVEVDLTTPSGVNMEILGTRFRVADLRYHLPKTVATLAIDGNCTLLPHILTRQLVPDRRFIRTNVQTIRILFRDSGYGNDVTLTWQPRSDMFSEDCWLVEQVPYDKPTLNFLVDEMAHTSAKVTVAVAAFNDAARDKILLDTKAGKP